MDYLHHATTVSALAGEDPTEDGEELLKGDEDLEEEEDLEDDEEEEV